MTKANQEGAGGQGKGALTEADSTVSTQGRRIGTGTATGLVVASMVGAGVFTTSGKLLQLLPSTGVLLLAWVVAGIAALCGAMVYAELAVALSENGGEYHILSRLLSPRVGFVSAWCTLVVGFAAPTAAVSLAFGTYLQALAPNIDARMAGAALLCLCSLLNGVRIASMSRVQNFLTALKLLLVVLFVVLGWQRMGGAEASRLLVWSPVAPAAAASFSNFAMALLWISFAYTGWNASCYLAGEVDEPERSLPRALLAGTALVTLLYLALNATFLAAAPLVELRGQLAVGHVAAVALFGQAGGRAMSALIALGLISTVGAMVVTGPRVYEAVGRDVPRMSFLLRKDPSKGPVVATAIQSGVALAMLLLVDFDELMVYIGFTLSVFSGLTVATVFRLDRARAGAGFRTPGYPWTPLVYLLLMFWQVAACIAAKPASAVAGAATLVSGWLLYAALRRPEQASGREPG